jgi:hypothetical protein
MVLGLLVLLPTLPLLAQDNVIIPKSRLEELERKEKELERLKGNTSKTNAANAKLKKESAKAAAKPPPAPTSAPAVTNAAPATAPATANVAPTAPAPGEPELERLKSELSKTKDENLRLKQENKNAAARLQAAPVVTHVSPPMDSLPSLRPGDIVDAMDLANYYHADAASADQRYRKQKFTVRGEVVAFEKPPFVASYRILLKTPDRAIKVICELNPPENANAVFTVNHGEQLVALAGERRVPMLKVGDTVQVAGWCKGADGPDVNFSGTDLKVAR